MAISTEKLLTLSQFQTGLQATKSYTDAQVSVVDGKVTANEGKITTLEGKVATLEANGYDDTEVRGLIQTNTGAISTNTGNIETLQSGKADKSTSLSGYGITDAYTKGEVDGLVASAFHYKGTKDTYAELPSEGNAIGDVWNITAADKTNGIKAGDNVAWSGESWDVLAGTVDLSAYSTTEQINGAITEATTNKADKATTLAGYGITDTYTKTEAEEAMVEAINNNVTINVATDEEVTAACTEVFGA